MFIKSLITFLVSILLASPLLSQERPPEPIDPNAAAMTQNISIPISEYTGQMSYSVPLHTIQLPDFQLPISLDYSYSGLKVESYPSDVGLGWSLSCLGVINREIRGIADEDYRGYRSSATPTGPRIAEYNQSLMSGAEIDQLKIDISERDYDPEMDMFSFFVPGHSGQFFFEHDLSAATVTPESELIILADFISSANNSNGEIQDFIIKDQRGNKYEFITPSVAGSSSLEYGDIISSNANTWYLQKITTLNGNTIEFNYYDRLVALPQTISEERFYHDPSVSGMFGLIGIENTNSINQIKKSVHQKTLNSIVVKNNQSQTLQEIEFKYGDERLDWKVVNNTGQEDEVKPKELNEIIIADGSLKKFQFQQSYFGNNSRLRLDGINQIGQEEIGHVERTRQIYSFEYHDENDFPDIGNRQDLFKQDYWGYYNGKNNSTLIPDTEFFDGADRSSDFNFSQLGSLTKINYPTGGWTEMKYESHDVVAGGESLVDLCSVEKFVWHEGVYADADMERYQFTLPETACMGVDYKLNRVCGDAAWIQISGSSNGTSGATVYHYDILEVDGLNAVTDSKVGSWGGELPAGSYSVIMWSQAEAPSCDDPSVEVTIFGPLSDQMDPFFVSNQGSNNKIQATSCSSNGVVDSFFEIPKKCSVTARWEYSLISENNIRASVEMYKFEEALGEYILIAENELKSIEYSELKYDSESASPHPTIILSGGKYKLSVNIEHLTPSDRGNQYATSMLYFPKIIDESSQNATVGGIRVQEMAHCDGSGNCLTTRYDYKLVPGGVKSSGVLLEIPGYVDNLKTKYYQVDGGVPGTQGYTDVPTMRFRNRSTSAVSSSHGSHVVYSKVTTDQMSDHSVLRTTKKFTRPDYTNSKFPHPPIQNRDFLNGKLENQQFWNIGSCEKDGLVKVVENQYQMGSTGYMSGIKIDRDTYYKGGGNVPSDPDLKYTFMGYSSLSGYQLNKGVLTTDYMITNAQNISSVSSGEILSYNNLAHKLVTSRTLVTSDDETIKTHYRYPQDGYLDGTIEDNSEGKDKTRVIEQYSTREFDGQIEGYNYKRTNYTDVGSMRLPSSVDQALKSSDEYEEVYQIVRYDNVGNVLETKDRSGVVTSYLWGFNNSLLVVVAVNANYDDVINNGGTHILETFNGTITEENEGLSTVRANLPEARITSYTHLKGVGITSKTDPNGITTYYYYDAFGRLKTIKKDGNIIKKYDYHYANQPSTDPIATN